MACKEIIVVSTYQLCANDFQEIQKALIMEHLFNIILALR